LENDLTPAQSNTEIEVTSTPEAFPEVVTTPTSSTKVALPEELQSVVATFLANFMSHETQKAYVSDWREFFAFLNARGIAVSSPNDVTESHVIAYRDYLREKFSPTTITRKLSALSSLFSRLKDEQLVKKNPVQGLRRPKAIVKRRRTGFTDQEVNRILESLNTQTLKGLSDKALLSFLFYTGARVSEMLSVRVKDIVMQEGMPVVHLRGKGEKLRTLPVVKAWALLDELIKRRGKNSEDYLFTSVRETRNVQMTRVGVHKLIKRRLKKLGLDSSRSAHSARRTVISNLLEAGERLELVQKVAGHSSPNVTLRSYNVREEPLSKNPLLNLRYRE
jgi:integrase/recombinase XerC